MLTGRQVINEIEDRLGYPQSATLEGTITVDTRRVLGLLNRVLKNMGAIEQWPMLRSEGTIITQAGVEEDMLLDLTAARAEHTRVSVTSLCIASGVPPTTALRWIGQMTDAGLLERVEDETDRRRAFIALTEKAADGMARYFAELGTQAARLV